MPESQKIHTHEKALSLNLDETIFGSFAEIGAGQEVARWFLRVGGASGTVAKTAAVAWLVAATFYFYQYIMRSAPAVMMPQLSEAFGVSALGVASIVGLFYYGYSPFSLVAGVAMDRIGPRRIMPLASATVV